MRIIQFCLSKIKRSSPFLWLVAAAIMNPASMVFASEITSVIADILPSQKQSEPSLIFLETDGRVLRIPSNENDFLSRFQEAARNGDTLHIEFTETGTIDLIDRIDYAPSEDPISDDEPSVEAIDSFYEFSTTRRYLTPSQIFAFLRSMRLRNSSQCFHRAQIWTYDLFRLKGIATNKVFLFFTPLYIRRYNYKWWFHVSPYVENANGELILDATYARSPLAVHSWTNIFIKNRANCPVLRTYFGTSSFAPGAYCHLRKVSMYYYHPSRIIKADRTGHQITQWDRVGLRDSQRARP